MSRVSSPASSQLYRAFAARDARFDGVFFVGVTSTGIYCRPVCTARTPKEANCRFFPSAEAAEQARFRPCLRCRPELAPGKAPVDQGHQVAELLVQRIGEGMLDNGAGLETVATRFGWSARQLRRIVRKELGVSPIELVLTRRLLLAKQLLTETVLPIGDVAFASGFSSLRRFNDAFGGRYRMPPTRFRKTAAGNGAAPAADTLRLMLSWRPPFDWNGLLEFLRARALAGVESVTADSYARTVQLGDATGWLRVTRVPGRNGLQVELSHSLTPVLPALLARLKHLFDLSARPDQIGARLSEEPVLANAVKRHPGLRVPGAFDGFELAVRAILGQQVSVKAATTIAARFVERFGTVMNTPFPELSRLTPAPHRVARTSAGDIASLGIVRSRAEAILALARAMDSGHLVLEPGVPPEPVIEQLVALPGVGAWTAQYIAMRALRWPDAFPKEDVIVRKRLGGVTARQAETMAEQWRPWRSYATLHLWRGDS